MKKDVIQIDAQSDFGMYFNNVAEKYTQNINLFKDTKKALQPLIITYQNTPVLPKEAFDLLDTSFDKNIHAVFLLIYMHRLYNDNTSLNGLDESLQTEIFNFSSFVGPLLQNTMRLNNQRNKKLSLAFEALKTTLLNKAIKSSNLAIDWLFKWATYLQKEDSIEPFKQAYYHQGEIILVDFGFRIGSELGGRHYAIVMEKNNNPHSPIIFLTPISSVKLGKPVPWGNVDLGNAVNGIHSMAVISQTGAFSKIRIDRRSKKYGKITKEKIREIENKLFKKL